MKTFRILCLAAAALMAFPAARAQTSSMKFSTIDIERPAPLVEFKDSRLSRISGGVEISLRSQDESVKPMRLAAKEILFSWADAKSSSPSRIDLKGDVRVDSPQGLISSNQADLDLKDSLLTFTGNVHGKSEDISDFDADKIVYNLDTGDSQMVNLRARGIGLGGAPDAKQSSTAGFSKMDIDRASNVKFSGGQVNSMDGGVAITLQPTGPNAKALKMNAASVGFAWAPDGKPSAIKMRKNVRVDGLQGDINADQADLNLASKQLDFTGNVSGSTDQIKSFETEKLAYNLDTGETRMTNLRARGLAIGQPPADPKDDKQVTFSRMDIQQAPQVSMTAGKLNWMRGGVNIQLQPDKKDEQPVTLHAQELSFDYSADATTPGQVLLKNDVNVDASTTRIQSDNANLNLTDGQLVFSGNVKGNMPGYTGASAQQFTYNLRTGDMRMGGAVVKEIDQHAVGKTGDDQKTKAPAEGATKP